MSCADGNKNAGFADLQTPQSVNNGQTMDREFFMERLADFSHLHERHRFIGLVIKVQGPPAMGFVPNKTIEGDNCPILVGTDFADNRHHVNGGAEQFEAVVLCRGSHCG